jgi:hypothetical protein
VDLCEGTPAKYRKNIFQPIELNEDSDDDNGFVKSKL